jgi:hypothetical protein
MFFVTFFRAVLICTFWTGVLCQAKTDITDFIDRLIGRFYEYVVIVREVIADLIFL